MLVFLRGLFKIGEEESTEQGPFLTGMADLGSISLSRRGLVLKFRSLFLVKLVLHGNHIQTDMEPSESACTVTELTRLFPGSLSPTGDKGQTSKSYAPPSTKQKKGILQLEDVVEKTFLRNQN